MKVRIKSTSFIKDNIALVRYTKEVERGLDQPQVTHWAATIVFKYSGAPMAEKDRATNPLGFQVLEYRNDPDTPTIETFLTPKPTTNAPSANGVTVFPADTTQAVPAIQ